MNINKKYLSILFLPTLILPTSVISCLVSSNNKNDLYLEDEILPPNDNNEIDKLVINENDFKVDISWKKGFRDENTFFFEGSNDYIFKLGEIIIDQDNYIVQYVGCENKVYYYSLYDKSIKKYYLLSLDFFIDKLPIIWSMSKIKFFIFENIVNSYLENMVINHNITDDLFLYLLIEVIPQ